MKKTVALVIVLAMLGSLTVFAHPFTDVKGHWAEAQLDIAYNNGMINGDPDGSFRPDDNISRAEYLKMLTAVTAKWLEISDEEVNRYDDGTHWVSKYYNFALHQGWVINYAYDIVDPEFDSFVDEIRVGSIIPGNMDETNFDIPIERWEMAYLASRFAHSLCGEGMARKNATGYTDYDSVKVMFPQMVLMHINCSYGAGIMTGDPDGKLNTMDNGTRAEAAVMVNRYIKMVEEEYKSIPETNVTYENIPEGHPIVAITFSEGSVVELELYPEYAPQTVAHFVEMVKSGAYDEEIDVYGVNKENYPSVGSICSFSCNKDTEKTVYGEFLKNGFEKNSLAHEKGTAVMDYMWSYNDASLDFRILAEDMPQNNGTAAAFGKVVSGMDFIETLSEESGFSIIEKIEIK